MIQPKSLQQRHSIFLILPVALLMVVIGLGGFFYARNLILSQWQEAAVLKLQRAAHLVDMQLTRVKELIGIFHQAPGDPDDSSLQFWAVAQLERQTVVDHVNLTWATSQASHDLSVNKNQFEGRSPRERHPGRAGRGMRMRRFHSGRIREITPPRFDDTGDHETVSLISDLNDETGKSIGRLEVVLDFEVLIINILESGWWQSNRAYLVNDNGNILTSAVSDKRETISDSDASLEGKIVKAMQTSSFGTLKGEGHPPDQISGFYKLLEAPWTLVMIAPGKEILAPIIRFRLYYFICGTAFIFVIVLIIRFVTGRTIADIKQVSSAADKVARGDYHQILPVKTRDEVGELTLSFNTMVNQLEERMQMKEAMNLAMEVQQNLLPAEMPLVKGFDIAGQSIYCDETGGDLFDFLELCCRDSDQIGIAVGDVSGHGISAALLMATVRAFLRTRVTQPGSPSEIINDVNRLVAHDTRETSQFMTLFYAEIDPSEKNISWIRAGHDPALLYSLDSDTFVELMGKGIALGIDGGFEYQVQMVKGLSQGQVLLIGTDGIWETQNESGEMFGKERLKVLIRRYAHLSSKRMITSIIEELQTFRKSAKQDDDITLAVIKADELRP
ncbi:SpoIIE family protein phosphatase [Thermodesulfobacteriota bacterium]